MHLQTSLIVAIASTALALPAANQTNSNLAKRYEHGWIGNFDSEYCNDTAVGSRPEIHLDDCLAFEPSMSAGFVGIFFGTGELGLGFNFDQLMLFSDTKCVVEMGLPLFKEDYTSGDVPACINYQDTGIFGSVQTTGSA